MIFIMRVSLFLFVFLIVSIKTYSQYYVKKIIPLSEKDTTGGPLYEIKWSKDKNFFVYTSSRFQKKDTIKVFVLEQNVKKTRTYYLPLPDTIMNNVSIEDISFNSDKMILAILNFYYVIFYDLNSGKMIDLVSNNKSRKIYHIGNNEFLLEKLYNFHPLDDSIQCEFKVYSLSQKKFIKTYSFHYEDIKYTILIHQFIDVYSNKILLSYSNKFKMFIFDNNLNKIDSININYLPMEKNLLPPNIYQPAKELYYYLKKLDTINTRIEKVFFNNDSSIIVSIRPPKSDFKYRTLLFLEKKHNQWSINKIIEWKHNKKITKKERWLDFTGSDKLLIKNNLIIGLYPYTPLFLKSKNKNKYYEKFSKENTIPVAFYIFQID